MTGEEAGVEHTVPQFALSVLDLAPVGRGYTPADALAASLRLAQEAERLGYVRFWVAEHHNMPGIASSSPPVLIAHLAAGTSSIRLGSGGLMLPNHSPLAVAEQFGMLEALHPGRIDLGLGRAPGTDQVTAAALRRTYRSDPGDDFPAQLGELLGYFNDSLPEGHQFQRIHAIPGSRLPTRHLAARQRVTTARSSPATSGCPSPSPTTSPATTPRPRSMPTARRSAPRPGSTRRT